MIASPLLHSKYSRNCHGDLLPVKLPVSGLIVEEDSQNNLLILLVGFTLETQALITLTTSELRM